MKLKHFLLVVFTVIFNLPFSQLNAQNIRADSSMHTVDDPNAGIYHFNARRNKNYHLYFSVDIAGDVVSVNEYYHWPHSKQIKGSDIFLNILTKYPILIEN